MANISNKFTTIQGTGRLTGTRQFFVRYSGCSVPCPIRKVCDEPDSLAFSGTFASEELLADEAFAELGRGGWVHITGGEPLHQLDSVKLLLSECHKRELKVHIQTSGTLPAPSGIDFLTVSPKVAAVNLNWNKDNAANELVVVILPAWDGKESVFLREYEEQTNCTHYYAQELDPPDGQFQRLLPQLGAHELSNWMAGFQLHKLIGVK